MNGRSGSSAMKPMNRKFFLSFALLATLAFPAFAQDASTSAPNPIEHVIAPLDQIGQIVVAEPNLANAQAATDCNIDPRAVQASISKILSDEKLPVIGAGVVGETDLLRVVVRPDIATLKEGVINCASYVSLRLESDSTVALPPLTEKKSVAAVMWQRGGLILTPVSDHPAGLRNAFEILARSLVKQYRLDNPDAVVPTAADPLAGIRK